MNILVTGATGYIGSNIVRKMSIKHNLYIFVRPKSKVENFPTNKVFIFNDNISQLSSFLNENKIDGVMHLASSVILVDTNVPIYENKTSMHSPINKLKKSTWGWVKQYPNIHILKLTA